MSTVTGNAISPTLLDSMSRNSAAATASAAASASQDVASEAQDRFMKLLVTQMKNQDPLNPLDNAQITSQLAQLSTVTGINKLNTSVESLLSGFQSNQTLQAAGMIGHGVFVPGKLATLSNGQALMGVELSSPADNVSVSIMDSSGREVQRVELGAMATGTAPIVWDGKLQDGSSAPDGTYSFTVSALRGGEKVNVTSLAYGEVTSVTTGGAGGTGAQLNVGTRGSFSMVDVRQIL